MFRFIDRSALLSRMFEALTGGLAKQRGLLTVIGVALVIVSFVLHLIFLSNRSEALEIAWSITHHLGIIIALIGILLVQPLGQ